MALGRAFGDQVTSEIGNEGGLSARAGRLLAGQLLARPRDLGTDSRLISALAAEAVGAVQTDATALRAAVLRGYVMERVEPGSSRVVVVEAKVGRGRGAGRAGRQGRGGADVPSAMPGEASAAPTVASGLERADVGAVAPVAGSAQATGVDGGSAQPGQASRLGVAAPTPSPNYAARPDLAGFALAVRRAAEVHAEGWPGNRKAFVCDVWEQIKATYPSWGLTNVEFKAMLTEAHRTGHLALANADLANKSRAREIQASAIAYKNTVWHLVRVEDPG